MTALAELGALLPGRLVEGDLGAFSRDATESRGLAGMPDAVVQPESTDDVAALVAWSDRHGVPLIPRGGGSGFAGGAVPDRGGVVVEMSRMNRILQFDPELWRIQLEAGVRTATVHRLARENGLMFPPDPGAADDSQIGGNIATNAGGPHAYKYGVTGDYVTGLTAVVPPGQVVRVGGALRKDVAGYDIKHLLIGSEGTLGIVTEAWLRLVPAPPVTRPIVATFSNAHAGCAALLNVVASGLCPSALEFLDRGAVRASRAAFPITLDPAAEFMVLADADGEEDFVKHLIAELTEALGEGALDLYLPADRQEIAKLWRWRDGISLAVESELGGKVSEDVAVPLDRLEEMIAATVEIGACNRLAACSWGHAGDGNLHSTFSVDPRDHPMLERAERAAEELFLAAARMRGSISGEHGVGLVKRGHLALQWSPAAVELHRAIKATVDPRNLMNPGKKT
jgi:glycolate dehydrogenase FAD-linked subunit